MLKLHSPKKLKILLSSFLVALMIFSSVSNEIVSVYSNVYAQEEDSEAPTAPNNLVSLSSTNTSVDLMWDSSCDNTGVSGYKIYRDGAEIGFSITTEYTDTVLKSNKNYTYTVRAYDKALNLSSASNKITVAAVNNMNSKPGTDLGKAVDAKIKQQQKSQTNSDIPLFANITQNIASNENNVSIASTGADFTLIKMADGTVKTWGRNSYGQLGLGDTTNRSTPSIVPGLEQVQQLASGNAHSLALLDDGTVKAWGYNNYGQLGIGSNANMSTPATIAGLSGVKQVVAGYDHSLALMNDGTVKAWGNNAKGQLGLGDTTNRYTPTVIPSLSGVQQLVGGLNDSFALLSDGTVMAWGANDYGKLGTGDTSYTYKNQPVAISGLTGVKQLSAGYDHVLALMEDGTVKAWGNNAQSRLGLGDTVNRSSPTIISGLTGVRQLAAGRLHSIAWLEGGTVMAWGANPYGQLGVGDTTGRTTPALINGISNPSQIVSGSVSQHTIAIMDDRTIKTWGYNYYGQLGSGDTANKNIPTSIADFKYNCSPKINIISPISDYTYLENGTALVPTINISDSDNDSIVCKYYIDDETSPREIKNVTDSLSTQVVIFNSVSISDLVEGNHTISFEISDGYGQPIVSTVNFKIDKSGPIVNITSVESTPSRITLNGTATDSISELDPLPFRFTIGTEVSQWISNNSYTSQSLLTPNTEYQIGMEAKNKNGMISRYDDSVYTKAEDPSLEISNINSDSMNVSVLDNNPPTTQYQIAVNNGENYVSQDGTLSGTPQWISIEEKHKLVIGLIPSTVYSFKVKAKNGENIETTWSSIVSESTLVNSKIPSAPLNLICLSKTANTIELKWDAPVDSADIAGYKIFCDGSEIGTTNATVYSSINLLSNTSYKYIVKSYNAAGVLSAGSNELTISTEAVTDIQCPTVPQNITASAIDVTTISLVWDPSSDDIGVVGYKVFRDSLEIGSTSDTYFNDANLTQGTTYIYTIKAYDAAGNLSQASGEFIVSTKAAADNIPPDSPGNLIAAEKTQNTINLVWDSSTDNVGVTGYRIYRDNVAVADVIEPNYTDTGLLPGTNYVYFVKAFDAAGNLSVASNVLEIATNFQIEYPQNFKAVILGKSIHLTWNEVPGAIGYDLSINGVIQNINTTEFVHSEILNGQVNIYKIRTVYSFGTSEWSTEISKTYNEQDELYSPNLSVNPKTNKVELSWDTINGATAYELYIDGMVIPVGNSNSYIHTNLLSNTQHTYKIRSVNQDYMSEWSQVISVTTTTLPKPANIISKTNTSSIELTWDNVDEAEGYEVEINNAQKIIVDEPKFIHNDLFSNSPYSYRIRAINGGGASEWSSVIKCTTGVLSAPTNIDVAVSNTKVIISWDPIEGASYYDVYVDGAVINNNTNTKYIHSGLTPNTTHTYKVRAVNGKGSGTWSYTYNITTLLLDSPGNIRSTGTQNSVMLNWGTVPSATGYEIEIDNATVVTSYTNSYKNTGLISDTIHTYKIRAKNTSGISAWSEPIVQTVGNLQKEIQGQWVANGSTQTIRYSAGSTQLNGKIYMIGGIVSSAKTAINEEYDPISNSWIQKASMSMPRYGLGVTNANGKIYAIGGFDGSNYLNLVEEYDPNTNSWIAKSVMPTQRSNFGIAVIDQKIYVIGGYNKSGYLNSVEEYDPANDTWKTKASMPTARQNLGVVVLNNKIYALGGYNGAYLGNVEEYDPAADRWIEKGIIQTARQSAGVVVSNQKIFIIGGQVSSTITTVEEYDPVTNICVTLTSLPAARAQFCAEVIDNNIYVIGGSGTSTNIIQKFVLSVPTNKPSIPGNIYVSMSSTAINLYWDSVTTATGYDIEIDGLSIKASTTNSYTHSAVTLGTEHTYRIRAKNISGNGEWSNVISAINPDVKYTTDIMPLMTSNSLPSPYIISASNTGSANAYKAFDNSTTSTNSWSVSETAPIGGHFLLIDLGVGNEKKVTKINFASQLKSGTDYGVKNWELWASQDGINFNKLTQGVHPNTGSYYNYVFNNDNTYRYYRLNVLDSYYDPTGKYIGVLEMELMCPVEIPVGLSAPANFSATSSNKNSMTLTWTAVSGATGYDIDCDGTLVSTTGTSYTHSSLLAGTGHRYRIRAKNSTQVGSWSEVVSKYTMLDAPGNLTAESTSTSVTARWAAVENATLYIVQADGKIYENGTNTTFVHNGLTPNTYHSYKVKVMTSDNYSDYGTVITCYSAPANAPIGVTATNIAGTSITISWSAVTGAVSYDVKVNGGFVKNVTSCTFTQSDLTPNKGYEFQIRSRNSGGVSDWSQIYSFNTLKNRGTVEDPYLIYTRDDLSSINNNLSSYYKLMSNVDLGNIEWIPIGSRVHPFAGQLDGNGYSIKNLVINLPDSNYVGLFSYLGSGACLKNIQLYVGDGGVTGSYYVGGLAGLVKVGSNIINCSIAGSGQIKGNIDVGGLVGLFNGINMSKCFSKVDVVATGTGVAGGLIGSTEFDYESSNSTITECFSTGNVTNVNGSAGGLIGESVNAWNDCSNIVNISKCYSTGYVKAKICYGLAGLCQTSIYYGNVYGKLFIENCFSTSTLEGEQTYPISNYFLGSHAGSSENCGQYSIKNSYFSGLMISENRHNVGAAASDYSYWAKFTNNYLNSKKANVVVSDGSGKTATDMKFSVTYKDWDFSNIWSIDEGGSYPYLKSLPKPQSVMIENDSDFAGGKGTNEDPLLIRTEDQLFNIRYSPNAFFKLLNNITLSSEWTPICTSTQPFKGTFDGNGYRINNLTINQSGKDYVGFFSAIGTGARLQNLTINNGIQGISGNLYVGSLAGYADNGASIDSCTVENGGSITGNSYVGGLIGVFNGSIISNSSSKINVNATGTGYAGGLIGSTASMRKGVLTGITYTNSTVSKCYSSGNVTNLNGTSAGLIGYSVYASNSYSNIVNINESYATGHIIGNVTYGLSGLCNTYIRYGNMYGKLIIKNCYSICILEGTYAYPISSYSMSGDTCEDKSSVFTISNCYFAGQMIATTKYGIGIPLSDLYREASFSNNYIDYSLNPIEIANDSGIKKSTSELMQQSTYSNWDYTNIWTINQGKSYPYLRNNANPTGITALHISNNSISLVWNAVDGADAYELEIDGGTAFYSTIGTTFEHMGLEPNSIHTYRVRSYRQGVASEWSPLLSVTTLAVLMPTPQNISAVYSNGQIAVSWNAVTEAKEYEIEVDGEVINVGTALIYTHKNFTNISQHTYRIRAKNAIATSNWSDMVSEISWIKDVPALCLTQVNWVGTENAGDDIEVMIKANNVTNMYTAQIELTYNPTELSLNDESITSLLWTDNNAGYFQYSIDETSGKIQLLISATGNELSKSGLIDIISLKFNLNGVSGSSIKVTKANIVNVSGNYIEVPPVKDLNVHVINE